MHDGPEVWCKRCLTTIVTDGLYGKVITTVSGRLVVSVPMAAVVVVVMIAMTELAVAQLIVAMLIVARNKGK